jgi:hypothetical protein
MLAQASLTVAGYPILEMGRDLDINILSCFRDTDLVYNERSAACLIGSRQRFLPGREVKFVITREDAISRLELMGFTFGNAGRTFYTAFPYCHCQFFPLEDDQNRSAQRRFTEYTFSQYSNLTRILLQTHQPISKIADSIDVTSWEADDDPVTFESAFSPLGFPSNDHRWALRVFLENAAPASQLVLDVTRFFGSDDPDYFRSACTDALARSPEEQRGTTSLSVLTESNIHSEFLKRTLALIYPPLVGYVRFPQLNPEDPLGRVQGLAESIDLLLTSGSTDRIVAIADNTAAARARLRHIDIKSLPGNIKLMYYPPIQGLRNYPTIGPDGAMRHMDVVDRAAGIELYFGEDVLRRHQVGPLHLVRWSNYLPERKAYHGEIEGKAELQERFRRKLRIAEETVQRGERPALEKFAGIQAILDKILVAFH